MLLIKHVLKTNFIEVLKTTKNAGKYNKSTLIDIRNKWLLFICYLTFKTRIVTHK